mmetsp:Transcript_53570/g.130936  ORF Transcript_53570/g.130936 Transcript_53570/m.130936 type:complete len:211 (-) Transcript_53570:1683-2315(-)
MPEGRARPRRGFTPRLWTRASRSPRRAAPPGAGARMRARKRRARTRARGAAPRPPSTAPGARTSPTSPRGSPRRRSRSRASRARTLFRGRPSCRETLRATLWWGAPRPDSRPRGAGRARGLCTWCRWPPLSTSARCSRPLRWRTCLVRARCQTSPPWARCRRWRRGGGAWPWRRAPWPSSSSSTSSSPSRRSWGGTVQPTRSFRTSTRLL